MGLNRKHGRIPNAVKERAKAYVDECGRMAYHYACYDCSFNGDKNCLTWDYPLIDCIVKELKLRRLW